MLKVKLSKNLPDLNIFMELVANKGEIHGLMGPIGSGKSTFLNMIAGLLNPDAGSIECNGKYIYNKDKNINIPTFQRKIGYVFQKAAIFPHLTVKENIIYAQGSYEEKKFEEIVTILKLQKLLNRYHHQLSGGESQKVALARVMASEPEILLLDEPFASLDPVTRSELQNLVLKIVNEKALPVIFVTHDQQEAEKMSTRVTFITVEK